MATNITQISCYVSTIITQEEIYATVDRSAYFNILTKATLACIAKWLFPHHLNRALSFRKCPLLRWLRNSPPLMKHAVLIVMFTGTQWNQEYETLYSGKS
jgi:hypothetical protein